MRASSSRILVTVGVIVGLFGWIAKTAWGMTLVREGKSKATIVISAEANEKVKTAAQELQAYVEKMSGAELPIVTDEKRPEGSVILVGRSGPTDELNVDIPSGLTPSRREEGFVIYCSGETLLLAGNDAGPYHGTEYAVYEFLNRLGVRWFMPGEYGEVVPEKGTIVVGNLEVRGAPDFVMRNYWTHTYSGQMREEQVRWKLRNKMNPVAMFAMPGDSSVRNVLAADKYFDEHPEYYAMNPDGSRNPHHPNLTHPKTVEIAAGIIKEHFRNNPNSNSYGFAPDDGVPRDYSPETAKISQGFRELYWPPGVPAGLSTSEEWFYFVNNVAKEVRKEFPDIYIATNGYANRDIPPQGVRLDDHLVIMFAAIWSCTLHAYDDEHCWQKVRQGQMLKRWCEMCDNVWIYGYNEGVLVSALTPIPMVHKLRRDLPLMKEWGVMGFYDEARPVWAECTIPSRYVRARLEWDADADVDAILDDFYARWYGKAARPMRAFYDALENVLENTPMHGHEDRVLPEVYTPELMVELRRHIREAEQLAGTETIRLHVRADRLIYEHLRAYVAMRADAAAGDFAGAAKQAERMLRLRKQLHDISPFLMPEMEVPYAYYSVPNRKKEYQALADKMSGRTGDLGALLPGTAMFRTDPHDDGRFEEWYKLDLSEAGWRPILTTRPFYCQGYQDQRGFPYVGYIWYRVKVDVPGWVEGKRVVLYVPIVENEAWCWVNGQYVGHRRYLEAYVRPAPMEIDVTDAVLAGQSNQITIRVRTVLAPAQAADGIMSRMFLYSPKGEGSRD